MSPIIASFTSGSAFGKRGGGSKFITASGGVITTSGAYQIHTFLGNENFVVTAGSPLAEVEYLIVGGGGGGGGWGGGGGAGGILVGSSTVNVQSYPIVVGGGGSRGNEAYTGGGAGTSSTALGFTAFGGGSSGWYDANSAPSGTWGSGGGGGMGGSGGGAGAAGTLGQGFAGGSGSGAVGSWESNRGGGGGGASQAGLTGITSVVGTTNAGKGGNGIQSSISGVGTFYGGGGGGHGGYTPGRSIAGLGGGGVGGRYQEIGGDSGLANTGGGGGGAYGSSGQLCGLGGTGIVIIRYLRSTVVLSTKGAITLSQGTQWFSSTPCYFGVELAPQYLLTNNATYTTVTYRRTSTNAYSWWLLFCANSSNSNTPVFGARISVPSGGSTGDTMVTKLSNAIETIGSNTIPSTGNHYISWISGSPGFTASNDSIFGDSSSGGSIAYVQTDTRPTTSTTYNTTTSNSGLNIHIKVS